MSNFWRCDEHDETFEPFGNCSYCKRLVDGSGSLPLPEAAPPREIIVEGTAGVVAEYNGRFWGTQYEDGHSTSYGYGPIEKARVSDPEYCKKPTDMTWDPRNTNGYNPNYDELKKGRLVAVRSRTVYWVDLPEIPSVKPKASGASTESPSPGEPSP